MKKKKKAAKPKPAKKAVRKTAKKKAASRSISRAVSPDCECRQLASGKWYRYIKQGGRKLRIPPAYDSWEECEENCES